MSVVPLDLLAQMDPVELLAPLAKMDLRYVLSCVGKRWNLTKYTQRSISLMMWNHRAWRFLWNGLSKRDVSDTQT